MASLCGRFHNFIIPGIIQLIVSKKLKFVNKCKHFVSGMFPEGQVASQPGVSQNGTTPESLRWDPA